MIELIEEEIQLTLFLISLNRAIFSIPYDAMLSSMKRLDHSFSEIDEQTLACLCEAHFSGFTVETKDTNSNEKRAFGNAIV